MNKTVIGNGRDEITSKDVLVQTQVYVDQIRRQYLVLTQGGLRTTLAQPLSLQHLLQEETHKTSIASS